MKSKNMQGLWQHNMQRQWHKRSVQPFSLITALILQGLAPSTFAWGARLSPGPMFGTKDNATKRNAQAATFWHQVRRDTASPHSKSQNCSNDSALKWPLFGHVAVLHHRHIPVLLRHHVSIIPIVLKREESMFDRQHLLRLDNLRAGTHHELQQSDHDTTLVNGTITWVAAYIMKSYVSDHWWTCAPWKPQKCWVPPQKNKNVKTVQIPQNLACIKGQGHSPQSLKTSVRSAAPFTHDHRTKWSLANDDRLSHQVNIIMSMTSQ